MQRVIADIGSNWFVRGETRAQGLERAKRMISKAAQSGAWAVKFQLYRDDLLNHTPVQAVKDTELPVEWLSDLHQVAVDNHIEFMVTPFYLDAVEDIAPFVNYFKIASHDLTYMPLLEKIAAVMREQGQSLFMSVNGAATLDEVYAAFDVFADIIKARDQEVTALYCTGGYPTPINQAEIDKIVHLASDLFKRYGAVYTGFSVHIPPQFMHIVAGSVYLGTDTFELHFIDDDGKGPEAKHSYSPKEFRQFVQMIADFKAARSCNCLITLGNDFALKKYRRNPEDWLRPFKRD